MGRCYLHLRWYFWIWLSVMEIEYCLSQYDIEGESREYAKTTDVMLLDIS